MILETGIRIGGILSLGLGVYHACFYRSFGWEAELKHVSRVNARIFMTIHLGLIAVFLFFTSLSFLYAREMAQCNGIAGAVTGGYALVWLARAVWQLTYLGLIKQYRPGLHALLTAWFLLLFTVYAAPVAVRVLEHFTPVPSVFLSFLSLPVKGLMF